MRHSSLVLLVALACATVALTRFHPPSLDVSTANLHGRLSNDGVRFASRDESWALTMSLDLAALLPVLQPGVACNAAAKAAFEPTAEGVARLVRCQADDADALVTETLVVREASLKHSYLLARGPRVGVLEMVLALNTTGVAGLRQVSDAKRGAYLELTDASNTVLFTYAALEVYDATGARVPSAMRLVNRALVFSVGPLNGVQYPLDIDPVATTPGWEILGTMDYGNYGYSLAIGYFGDGDQILDFAVGAPYVKYPCNGQIYGSGVFYTYRGVVNGGQPQLIHNHTLCGNSNGYYARLGWNLAFKPCSTGTCQYNQTLAISAPRYGSNSKGEYGDGAIWFLKSTSLSGTLTVNPNRKDMIVFSDQHLCGSAIAWGDFYGGGDGNQDFLLTCPATDTPNSGSYYCCNDPNLQVPQAQAEYITFLKGKSGATLATNPKTQFSIDGSSNPNCNNLDLSTTDWNQVTINGGNCQQNQRIPYDQLKGAYGQFAKTVVSGYNYDGNAGDDIWIGATGQGLPISGWNGDGLAYLGAVYVVSGQKSGTSNTPDNDNNLKIRIWGDEAGGMFGYAIANCDLNADGYKEMIISAPTRSNALGVQDAGRIYVFNATSGSYKGATGGQLNVSFARTIDGEGAYGRFGTSVVCAGDVNKDGYEDIWVGAPGYGSQQQGRVYLFSGSASGIKTTPTQVIDGVEMNSGFGRTLVANFDYDGDSWLDLLVGMPNYNYTGGPNNDMGRIQFFKGRKVANVGFTAFSIDKTSPLANQDSVVLSMTVQHNGPSTLVDATNVFITVSVPAAFQFTTASSGCTMNGQLLTCAIGTLHYGNPAVMKTATFFTRSDAMPIPAIFYGTVNLTEATESPNTKQTATCNVRSLADLVMAPATMSPGLGVVGSLFSFGGSFAKSGISTALDVQLKIPLPAGLSFVNVSISQGGCFGTLTCVVGNMPTSGTVTFLLYVKVNQAFTGGTATLNAYVSTNSTESNYGDNSATGSATITVYADLSISMIVTPPTVDAGTEVSMSSTLVSGGPSFAGNVVYTSVLPSDLEVKSILAYPTTVGVVCSFDGASVTCTVPSVATNSIIIITVNALLFPNVTQGTNYQLTASVSSTTQDFNMANNQVTKSITSRANSQGELVLVGPNSLPSGATCTFTAQITVGPSDMATSQIVLEGFTAGYVWLTYPAGCTITPPTGGSVGDKLTCSLGKIDGGSTITPQFQMQMPIASDTTPSIFINGQLSGTSNGGNLPATVQAHFTVTLTIPTMDINLQQFLATPLLAVTGQTVNLTVIAGNNGPSSVPGHVTIDRPPVDSCPIASITPSQGACDNTGAKIECEVGTLSPRTPTVSPSVRIEIVCAVGQVSATWTLTALVTTTAQVRDVNMYNNNLTATVTTAFVSQGTAALVTAQEKKQMGAIIGGAVGAFLLLLIVLLALWRLGCFKRKRPPTEEIDPVTGLPVARPGSMMDSSNTVGGTVGGGGTVGDAPMSDTELMLMQGDKTKTGPVKASRDSASAAPPKASRDSESAAPPKASRESAPAPEKPSRD